MTNLKLIDDLAIIPFDNLAIMPIDDLDII